MTYGFAPPRDYTVEWYGFDNAKDMFLDRIGTGSALPPAAQSIAAGSYIAARIHAGDAAMQVHAFLRQSPRRVRSWSDSIAHGPARSSPYRPHRCEPHRQVFADLTPQQRALFETYVRGYNESRGSQFTPEQGFDRLTISEQTTFYGVTHALMNSTTDRCGRGVARDRARSRRVDRTYRGAVRRTQRGRAVSPVTST